MKFVVLLGVCVCACTGPDSPYEGEPTAPPLSEKLDGTDLGDRDCNVVLDRVTPPENDSGEEGCRDAFACSWRAFIDVRDSAPADKVGVMYTVEGRQDDLWFAITGTEADESSSRSGYRRTVVFFFAFPSEDLSALVIEMIPFYSVTGGGRVFDHNRNDGSHENYVLDESNDWTIESDPTACP